MSPAYDATVCWPLALMGFAAPGPYHRIALVSRRTVHGFSKCGVSCAFGSHHRVHHPANCVAVFNVASGRFDRMNGIVSLASCHDGPGDARHLVGERHSNKLERLPGQQRSRPIRQRRFGFAALDPVEGSMSPHHQQAPEIVVAHLRDTSEPRLAACRMLLRHQPEPGGNSRPPLNAVASFTVAVSTVAIRVPMPGTVASR